MSWINNPTEKLSASKPAMSWKIFSFDLLSQWLGGSLDLDLHFSFWGFAFLCVSWRVCNASDDIWIYEISGTPWHSRTYGQPWAKRRTWRFYLRFYPERRKGRSWFPRTTRHSWKRRKTRKRWISRSPGSKRSSGMFVSLCLHIVLLCAYLYLLTVLCILSFKLEFACFCALYMLCVYWPHSFFHIYSLPWVVHSSSEDNSIFTGSSEGGSCSTTGYFRARFFRPFIFACHANKVIWLKCIQHGLLLSGLERKGSDMESSCIPFCLSHKLIVRTNVNSSADIWRWLSKCSYPSGNCEDKIQVYSSIFLFLWKWILQNLALIEFTWCGYGAECGAHLCSQIHYWKHNLHIC